MAAKWIKHKGKLILYQDYKDLKEDEMLETLDQTEKLMVESPSLVLTLSNVENAAVTTSFMERSKVLGKTVFDKKVEKAAVVGITGLKQIFYNVYTKISGTHKVKACSSEIEALDWLVQ